MSENPAAAFKGDRMRSQRPIQFARGQPTQWNQEDPGDAVGNASE